MSGRSYTQGAAGKGPALVELTLEQRRAELPAGDDSVGWEQVPSVDPVTMDNITSGSVTTWTGSVEPPGGVGSRPYRVVVREYELIPRPKTSTPGRRLVYADALVV